MRFLNSEREDYHIHSMNYSDGFNTIDDIVRHAGELGMRRIAITDHSQAAHDVQGWPKRSGRSLVKRWQELHDAHKDRPGYVEVIFGQEGDLLNERGDVCFDIAKVEYPFSILSYHDRVYNDPVNKGDPRKVAEGFINAIRRHGPRIAFIGHVCNGLSEDDAARVIEEANRARIPVELNGQYFLRKPESWTVVLEKADQVYVNSDAHMLLEMQFVREATWRKLREMGYSR